MASSFTGASSSFIRSTSTPVTAAPLTMACWFNSTNVTAAQVMMSIGVTAGTHRFHLAALGNAAVGDPLSAFIQGSTQDNTCNTTTSYTANKWHHAAAVFSSATIRSVFLDGGGKGSGNGTSVVPAGLNEILIAGRRISGTIGASFNGLIAEVGIWNAALTDDEILSLSKGFAPYLIRPQNLRFYNRLIRNKAMDLTGGRTLILSNAFDAAHPRIYG